MSVEDKIRRAEEIYYKRRMGENVNKNTNIWRGKDAQREVTKDGLRTDLGYGILERNIKPRYRF